MAGQKQRKQQNAARGEKAGCAEEKTAGETIRLNKLLSEAGICSRREADRLIQAGRVTVDGHRAETGMQVAKGQLVCMDGEPVRKEAEVIFLAVNKPAGVVCTTEKKWGDTTLEELVHYPKRVFSMGRLDKDSEGLILMTNQGNILNKMMKAGNYHEKEYVVTVDKAVTPDFLSRMREGVWLKELDTRTRPCRVEKAGEKRFRIILTQGLNRQIRRMCEYFGYHVVKLVRVRIMNIELGELPSGKYRHLTKQELSGLQAALKNSQNNTELQYQRKSAPPQNRRAPGRNNSSLKQI
ncbi:MAG: pseudouridine synthase [Lachnospiraceae bacterium]|nr:pseudouridine synthase [Lachnospiraceae bacterium]